MYGIQKIFLFLQGTLLSALVFLSVSFITFLLQVNPLHYYQPNEEYNLAIGFPFVYYEQFWTGDNIPDSGWRLDFLVYDILITWMMVVAVLGLRLYFKKEK